jgi:MoxR-like ATPase
MDGRFSVSLEDVQKVAIPVLRHRISTNFQAQAEGQASEDLIQRLIRETPPPVIPKYEK